MVLDIVSLFRRRYNGNSPNSIWILVISKPNDFWFSYAIELWVNIEFWTCIELWGNIELEEQKNGKLDIWTWIAYEPRGELID